MLLWPCPSSAEKTVINVGVVLDLSETVGKIGLSCINMSLSDFYDAHPHYNTRMLLHVRDSQTDVVTAASAGTYFFN
ncbi:Glutamate receptor 2 [Arachis hypogaea]|nr:Glutamate receptor 2 [Arachis hypogaea]